MVETKKNEERPKGQLIEDVIFYAIMAPLVLLIIMLVWQRVTKPNRIPDIFGYKMFIVLDGNMDRDVDYGDLLFTKNIKIEDVKDNQIIAYRSNEYTVTIYRVNKNGGKTYLKRKDNSMINQDSIEGVVVNKIARIGLIIYFAQDPYIIAFLIIIVLIIGLIMYYIAQEIDKRNEEVKNES